jgi:hypothetical protein
MHNAERFRDRVQNVPIEFRKIFFFSKCFFVFFYLSYSQFLSSPSLSLSVWVSLRFSLTLPDSTSLSRSVLLFVFSHVSSVPVSLFPSPHLCQLIFSFLTPSLYVCMCINVSILHEFLSKIVILSIFSDLPDLIFRRKFLYCIKYFNTQEWGYFTQ